MKNFLVLLLAILFVPAIAHAGHGTRFILVGDSTVSVDSGWGPAFCADVNPGVTCLDMARGGRSSKSYREDGTWATVMEQLKQNSKFDRTYVLIQFGHNDQPGKPGRSTDVATEFPANMRHFVQDVKSTGAQAILITSLSRRTFDADGHIRDSLGPWADATRQAAKDEGVPCLDLHADSIALLEKMGKIEADTLAMAPPPDKNHPAPAALAVEVNGKAAPRFDGTHLGAKGAALFAHVVEKELVAAVPEAAGCFRPLPAQ